LRGKLLLAQLPLGLALVALGILSVAAVSQISRHLQLILQDNYRSVLAAQRMKEAIERLDSAALFIPLGKRDLARQQIKENRQRFEAELKIQENNITEPGEQEATDLLRALWTNYDQMLQDFVESSDDDPLADRYFAELQPVFAKTKDAADLILTINQDAIIHKNEETRTLARTIDTALVGAAVAACLFGLVLSRGLTDRMLRPLSVLSQAVNRLGAGDFKARAVISGADEISQLAAQFNTMAERLLEYRSSSLGELLLAQQASQAAIDSIPDPVIVFTPDGGVLKINSQAEKLLMNGQAEAPANVLDSLNPEIRRTVADARLHVLQGKGPYTPGGMDEAFSVAASDGNRYFLLRATPVYEERGEIIGVTVIFQDVTRLHRYDELKNALVTTVAHEFRTPLTSLRLAIHLCLEGAAGPLTEKQADLLHAGREDCERLQTTVDELLDLARLQSGRVPLDLQPVAPARLAKEAIAAMRNSAEDKQVHLSFEPFSSDAQVLADPDRIQVVFLNLLSNAIRHSPRGETVTVRARSVSDQIRFEVSDAGDGVPKEYRSAIFERFFRVPGSTSSTAGLGLSLAKEIVEAHNGKIGVDSNPGRGSTFWFTLPVVSENAVSLAQ
jgi:two-component system, NtrC family, sensor histidine kinase KinB